MKKLKRDYMLFGICIGIAFSMLTFAILTLFNYL